MDEKRILKKNPDCSDDVTEIDRTPDGTLVAILVIRSRSKMSKLQNVIEINTFAAPAYGE